MKLVECPDSKLMLPPQFIDERRALANVINKYVDQVCNENDRIDGAYFLTLKARFDKFNPEQFNMDRPKITKKLPPFLASSLVYWICNKRGIKELLWMVSPTPKGEKLKVEFNKKGVAYLQAKGAMPKDPAREAAYS